LQAFGNLAFLVNCAELDIFGIGQVLDEFLIDIYIKLETLVFLFDIKLPFRQIEKNGYHGIPKGLVADQASFAFTC
jgi:hypothetical protein